MDLRQLQLKIEQYAGKVTEGDLENLVLTVTVGGVDQVAIYVAGEFRDQENKVIAGCGPENIIGVCFP